MCVLIVHTYIQVYRIDVVKSYQPINPSNDMNTCATIFHIQKLVGLIFNTCISLHTYKDCNSAFQSMTCCSVLMKFQSMTVIGINKWIPFVNIGHEKFSCYYFEFNGSFHSLFLIFRCKRTLRLLSVLYCNFLFIDGIEFAIFFSLHFQ